MKKIILIIFASLMFCNIGYAEMRLIESKTIKDRKFYNSTIGTVCVDGYKFVVSYNSSQMISMVQFFERAGGVSLPAKC